MEDLNLPDTCRLFTYLKDSQVNSSLITQDRDENTLTWSESYTTADLDLFIDTHTHTRCATRLITCLRGCQFPVSNITDVMMCHTHTPLAAGAPTLPTDMRNLCCCLNQTHTFPCTHSRTLNGIRLGRNLFELGYFIFHVSCSCSAIRFLCLLPDIGSVQPFK